MVFYFVKGQWSGFESSLHYNRERAEGLRQTLAEDTLLMGDYTVEEVELEELPGQRVVASGLTLGVKFNRKTYGSRTLPRVVRNLRREDGRLVGESSVMGQPVRVHLIVDGYWLVDGPLTGGSNV